MLTIININFSIDFSESSTSKNLLEKLAFIPIKN